MIRSHFKLFHGHCIFSICFFVLFFLFTGSVSAIESEPGLYPHYPTAFDRIGKIDRIGEREMVVDDSLYSLKAYTTFATPGKRIARKSEFQEGNVVGLLLNADQEVVSVWLLKVQ